MDPVPRYDDLIWLFEDEPVDDYADEHLAATGLDIDWRETWPYAAVTFSTTRAGIQVKLSIKPDDGVVHLRLRADSTGAELVDLELRGVRTVSVERIKNRELLRIDFPDDAPAAALWLRVKPDITLAWSYGRAPW